MIRTLLLAGAGCFALTGIAVAAAPSAAQKAEFYDTCVGISQNVQLCSCKADAAMTLVDDAFMAVIIAAMKGKAPPGQYEIAYNDYIAASTRECGMGGI